MLQLLHIENIAVIEEADIVFDEGFNALTGRYGRGAGTADQPRNHPYRRVKSLCQRDIYRRTAAGGLG